VVRTSARAENVGSTPTYFLSLTSFSLWACSSIGRASALQAECRRFDSGQVHLFQNGAEIQKDTMEGLSRCQKCEGLKITTLHQFQNVVHRKQSLGGLR